MPWGGLGGGLVSGIVGGEALAAYLTVRDTTSGAYWIVQGFVGLALPALVGRRTSYGWAIAAFVVGLGLLLATRSASLVRGAVSRRPVPEGMGLPLWQAQQVIAGQQSRTARYAAFFRALESRRPARQRLFDDPLAVAFLDRSLRAAVVAAGLPAVGRALPWLLDRWVPGPRPSAVVRTRLIDDAVRSAVAAGVQQVVILGAGFDTRAYRMAELRRLAVFEVDHPDTQAAKLHVLEGELETWPDQVTFVPVDLDRDQLANALTDAGLRSGLATFTIWEGVASYLTPQAVDATVRWARGVSGPGSHLMLTYVDRGLIDKTSQFPHAAAWVRSVARAGEPFVFGFEPADLPRYLSQRGWDLVADVSTTEALVQYGLSSRRVPSFYRIAHAS